MSSLALIAAPPNSLRYSLQALLAGLPQITSVQSVEDARSLIAALALDRPRLVVVDINLPGPDTLTILAQLIALAPQARRIVLVDHAAQQQALQPAPADLVLLKGFPAAELYALLEKLLAQKS